MEKKRPAYGGPCPVLPFAPEVGSDVRTKVARIVADAVDEAGFPKQVAGV